MADSNLSDLDEELQPLAQQCLDEYISNNPNRHPARITVTWRSAGDQQAAYDAGLSKCKPGEGKHNVTVDGKPASRAFDFACFLENGNYIADGTHQYYSDFGAIAERLGLSWGGSWTHGFKDYDHIELRD